MAFLLLLHEKMRLKRQVNKLTLKQLQYGSRLDRMTKNISRVQKMYSSKMSQLEKQAQMMQSQATVFFQNYKNYLLVYNSLLNLLKCN